MTDPKSDTLDVPGAVLHYDIRRADATTEPALLIIGSPMGADGFTTLAGHFSDRTVVTYDPRGRKRSLLWPVGRVSVLTGRPAAGWLWQRAAWDRLVATITR